MIDIINPKGIAVDIKDAIGDVALDSAPELLGRLVERLVATGIIDANDLRYMLPQSYDVREL